ncbi:hypothetical protein P7I13_12665 [Lactococcus lactis]|uniref:hypothetical protein n=1 Tax=Lactococcus lactis TaxID=1358 RepID=UPI000A6B6A65|nr:hypothetical protein [Lactococcus lactis]MDT2952624.1 hypothetical protein [Lactococcus lactis]
MRISSKSDRKERSYRGCSHVSYRSLRFSNQFAYIYRFVNRKDSKKIRTVLTLASLTVLN